MHTESKLIIRCKKCGVLNATHKLIDLFGYTFYLCTKCWRDDLVNEDTTWDDLMDW